MPTIHPKKELREHTVDGSEIRRAPVEVGILSHYLGRVLAPPQVVGNGISEPSTHRGAPGELPCGVFLQP